MRSALGNTTWEGMYPTGLGRTEPSCCFNKELCWFQGAEGRSLELGPPAAQGLWAFISPHQPDTVLELPLEREDKHGWGYCFLGKAIPGKGLSWESPQLTFPASGRMRASGLMGSAGHCTAATTTSYESRPTLRDMRHSWIFPVQQEACPLLPPVTQRSFVFSTVPSQSLLQFLLLLCFSLFPIFNLNMGISLVPSTSSY